MPATAIASGDTFKPRFFRNPNFLDVTALSHEVAETFNDPSYLIWSLALC
jgi:hypothetical protein